MSYLTPHSLAADLCVDLTPLIWLSAARPDRHGPDLVLAASEAQAAGADAIGLSFCGMDSARVAALVPLLTAGLHLPLVLRMPATTAMVALANDLRAQRICLVPQHALSATLQIEAIRTVVLQLQAAAIPVALAIQAEPEQLQAAFAAGASAIELNASQYAAAENAPQRGIEFDRIATCASAAIRLGMTVQVAHGLDHANVGTIAALEDIAQLQTGHALLSRAVFVGWQRAVGEMKAALSQARSGHPRAR